MNKTGLDPALIDYVLYGSVIQESRTSNIAREAAMHAGHDSVRRNKITSVQKEQQRIRIVTHTYSIVRIGRDTVASSRERERERETTASLSRPRERQTPLYARARNEDRGFLRSVLKKKTAFRATRPLVPHARISAAGTRSTFRRFLGARALFLTRKKRLSKSEECVFHARARHAESNSRLVLFPKSP